MRLTAAEGRVLGCLVEKALTTPQAYPLTENALIAACNQSTSRDPVVSYDANTVRLAVRSLREQQLLRTVHRSGERSDKHLHLLEGALGLSAGQVALVAVLLLRGPQTAAELRARCERLHAFGGHAEVEEALDGLAGRDEPLVRRLPREPGRKESRYVALLVDERAAVPLVPARHPPVGAAPAGPPAPAPVPEPVPTPVTGPVGAHAAAPAVDVPTLAALVEQVALLRAEVAELRRRVETFARES